MTALLSGTKKKKKITVFKSANTELFHHMVPIKDSQSNINWSTFNDIYMIDMIFFMMFPVNPYKNDEPRKSKVVPTAVKHPDTRFMGYMTPVP